MRGQVFGLQSTGLMAGQAMGALIGGSVASAIGVGSAAAAQAMGVMAALSVAVSIALIPGLRRSRLVTPLGGQPSAAGAHSPG